MPPGPPASRPCISPDAIAAAHTCPESGPIRAGTPASEYLFLDDTAAPLACINLLALADAKGFLDAELFDHVVRLSTVMLDISVGIAQYPSRDMARRTLDTRPVGLGFANLAGLFARLGIAYDSAEARATAAAVSGLLTAQAQVTSAELAKELGAFGDFARNRAPYLKTLAERRAAAEQGFAALPQDELRCCWPAAWKWRRSRPRPTARATRSFPACRRPRPSPA